MSLRADLAAIAGAIPAGSRVLDVGCGDGALMRALRDEAGCDVRGLELDGDNVAACVAAGLAVVQGDADTDLADYPTAGFDVAILSQTLQTTRRPDRVLGELLRVAARGFVSFPNFAHWRVRASLAWGGRMPVTQALPSGWYDTPNIHHLTIDDFRALADARGLAIEAAWFFADGRPSGRVAANWRADQAVFAIRARQSSAV